MAIAGSFRELRTYQKAREGAKSVYQLTKTFPKEERYSMTDQIRRSSRAVKALLAEAWARRRYKGSFVHKIDESLGEAMETQAWHDDALDCEYINEEQHRALDVLYQQVGGMLSNMISKADDFCKNAPDHSYIAEDSDPYGLSAEDL